MFFKKQKNVIKLTQQGERMKYDSQGFIQISAYTAAGALPVPSVTVKISGNEEGNIGIEYSLITDRNGLTEVVALPTPAKSACFFFRLKYVPLFFPTVQSSL